MGVSMTSDKPGSAGVASALAGMAFELGWVQVTQPISMNDQGLAPYPTALMNNPN
jgi:hypothetical protein